MTTYTYTLNSTHYASGTRGMALWMTTLGGIMIVWPGAFWLAIAIATLMVCSILFPALILIYQLPRPRWNRTPFAPHVALMLFGALTIWTAHRVAHIPDNMLQDASHWGWAGFWVGALGTLIAFGVLALNESAPVTCPMSKQLLVWEEHYADVHPQQQVQAQAAPAPQPQELENPEYRYPARTPEKRFADLYGYAGLKDLLLEHASKWDAAGENGLLLYGPPGTGKTAFATALAGELGLPIITVSFGDLASKWINQTTEQLMQLFDEALAQAPCVLFLDEIESVLGSREGGSTYDEYQRMTSAFLSKIEAVRRDGRVLYIGATNYPDRLDAAAIRPGRFDWRAEVPLPDYPARRGLMLDMIRKRGLLIADELLDRFAKRWQGFNVPQLQGATKAACDLALKDGGRVLRFAHLYRGLRTSQGPRAAAPEGSRPLDTLTLNPGARSAITGLIEQMRNLEKLEAEGGSMVKGAVFYGPPGTGKTTVAKAIALEAQWPLITRMGKDLMDVGAVAKLRNEVNSLRPCIVFIDEADDILGHRAYSGVKAATNELLALIDGAHSLPDVLWIAATNDPDGMDSAALRGGRFEMKVPFLGLEDDALRHYLLNWLEANPRAKPADPERWIAEATPLLRGMVPGNLDAILRTANNRAILDKQRGGDRNISAKHIAEAMGQIMGDSA